MKRLSWRQNPEKELHSKDRAVIYPGRLWRVCCCLLLLEWVVDDFEWEMVFLTRVVQSLAQFVLSEKVCSSPSKLM
jgi:hypothetical protein